MTTASNEPIRVLIVEDVKEQRETIVDAFRFSSGVTCQDGSKRRFDIVPVSSLRELAKEKGKNDGLKKYFDLAVVDLSLPEGELAGTLAKEEAQSFNAATKVVIFSGRGGSSQELLDTVFRIGARSLWDYFIKGRPTDLVERIVAKWEAEEAAESRRVQASDRSLVIRRSPPAGWKDQYVAFYVDSQNRLRPDPGINPADQRLIQPTYLEALIEYHELRQTGAADMPEQPFIALLAPNRNL